MEKVYNLFKGHTYFREILSNIPEKQKALLYAIAGEGEAERITSSDFIKRHGLTSASSVQSAAKKLLEKDIITGPRGRRRLRGILLLRCGLFKPVYLYSADAGVGGGQANLNAASSFVNSSTPFCMRSTVLLLGLCLPCR